jgi:hypothetical protein
MAMPAISPDRRDPEMAKNVIFNLEWLDCIEPHFFWYENVLVFGMGVEQCMNKLCI